MKFFERSATAAFADEDPVVRVTTSEEWTGCEYITMVRVEVDSHHGTTALDLDCEEATELQQKIAEAIGPNGEKCE